MSAPPRRAPSRRKFLTHVAASIVAAPYVITWPRRALGQGQTPRPSNRIAMGFIGVGGQGGGHLVSSVGNPAVQVLAVCDVDKSRRGNARSTVERGYAAQMKDGSYKGCDAYTDFRELCARKDIDAVLIATPDHWHCLTTLEAFRNGKDVYCEKPLSLTIREGQAMVDAARRYSRVFQTGSHERSGRNCRYACELVRNGRIGNLKEVQVGLPIDRPDCGLQPTMPVPANLDYDQWLGPAPWAPYTEKRVHFHFRYIFDYSGGEMTDRGAHVGDIALWGASPFLRGPVEIETVGKRKFYENSLYNTPIEYTIEFRFAGGPKFVVANHMERGIKFIGDEGWIFVVIHGGALSASKPSVLKSVIGPNEIHLHESPGHREDFWNAVRTRGTTVANVEEGNRSAIFCHLCNIAMRLGRKITWDWEKETFVKDPEAERLTWRPMRAPWTV